MLYATGDTHGDFRRFRPDIFPEQAELGREDYVLICGDFGGVWNGSRGEARSLDFLEGLPFTTLFVSGNHENFDRLARYPTELWHGGRIQRIRPHVLHLTRGQLFHLGGHTLFTMGGASSHDIADGILNPADPDFQEQYQALRSAGASFRVNHRSWWRQELPSLQEYREARETLARCGWQADYIVTHCAPTSVQAELLGSACRNDPLTDFLEEVNTKATFHRWLFGHYHQNRVIRNRFILLWEQIVRVF